jgi:hypothetical protein
MFYYLNIFKDNFKVSNLIFARFQSLKSEYLIFLITILSLKIKLLDN